ncbi:hypothetical protein LSAT2_032436 [Lamellibrachia satsuma]|nr:hypothetical protein LSAT2_032436 [Lamellibrachia satsuma]
MKWVFAICVLCVLAQTVFSISHRTSLIWTEKAEWGGVKISGVAGDPDDWFQNGTTVLRGAAAPVDFFSRILSHRIALAFQYSSKQLFFSDRGFKGIFQLKLQVVKGDHYSYNATVETVYRSKARVMRAFVELCGCGAVG